MEAEIGALAAPLRAALCAARTHSLGLERTYSLSWESMMRSTSLSTGVRSCFGFSSAPPPPPSAPSPPTPPPPPALPAVGQEFKDGWEDGLRAGSAGRSDDGSSREIFV